MGTQSAESTKLGRGKLGSARALRSSRSSEHRRGVAAGAEPPRAAPPPPAPGTGGRGHRLPASRPGAAAAPGDGGGHGQGLGTARGCAEPVPLFHLSTGQEKAACPGQTRGPRWGTDREQLVPSAERQQ